MCWADAPEDVLHGSADDADLDCDGHLGRKKRAHSTHFVQTEVLVEKIIRLSIGTGSLTAIISIIGLGLTFLPSHADYYQAPIPALAKLYATTLMVHLNSRMKCSGTAESQAWTDSNKTRTSTVIDCGGIQCRVSSMQFRDTDLVAAKRRSLMPGFLMMDEGARGNRGSQIESSLTGKNKSQVPKPDIQEVSNPDSPTIV
ncbi:hypothetical protein HYPSUDRAFT_439379 [Hypholoma sublateritium FD-334 SS-4]|uniref:DUF6534 domain-containing protein n=1 Tax=Hypholoma sublateritium (strain FD-334 SS-4) TaxID=945553 RepID=A0A0D2P2H9_HYPSF|nr:hypothetical protein HYPSUDRAFT_439379 [Hypholoma sublateritium FD-334 SS-4]